MPVNRHHGFARSGRRPALCNRCMAKRTITVARACSLLMNYQWTHVGTCYMRGGRLIICPSIDSVQFTLRDLLHQASSRRKLRLEPVVGADYPGIHVFNCSSVSSHLNGTSSSCQPQEPGTKPIPMTLVFMQSAITMYKVCLSSYPAVISF